MCALQRVAMQHPNSHCRRLLAAAPAGPDSPPVSPLSPDAGTAGPPRAPPHPALGAPFPAGCGPAWRGDGQQSDVAELRQRHPGAISLFPHLAREQRGRGARFGRRPAQPQIALGKEIRTRSDADRARPGLRAGSSRGFWEPPGLGDIGAQPSGYAHLGVRPPRGTHTAVHPSGAPSAERPSVRASRTPHTRPFPHAPADDSLHTLGVPPPAPHPILCRLRCGGEQLRGALRAAPRVFVEVGSARSFLPAEGRGARKKHRGANPAREGWMPKVPAALLPQIAPVYGETQRAAGSTRSLLDSGQRSAAPERPHQGLPSIGMIPFPSISPHVPPQPFLVGTARPRPLRGNEPRSSAAVRSGGAGRLRADTAPRGATAALLRPRTAQESAEQLVFQNNL